jgi:hypothetical protein
MIKSTDLFFGESEVNSIIQFRNLQDAAFPIQAGEQYAAARESIGRFLMESFNF